MMIDWIAHTMILFLDVAMDTFVLFTVVGVFTVIAKEFFHLIGFNKGFKDYQNPIVGYFTYFLKAAVHISLLALTSSVARRVPSITTGLAPVSKAEPLLGPILMNFNSEFAKETKIVAIHALSSISSRFTS